MGSPSIDKRCPHCGEWTPAAMPRCQVCGESEDGRRAPPEEAPVGVEDFLLPLKANLWSMLACYIGLLGCILPVVGFFPGILAIFFGVIALRRSRQGATYHAVTNDLRAIFGLVFGVSSFLIWGAVLIWIFRK